MANYTKNSYLPINNNFEQKISKCYTKRELLFKILVIGDFGVGELFFFCFLLELIKTLFGVKEKRRSCEDTPTVRLN